LVGSYQHKKEARAIAYLAMAIDDLEAAESFITGKAKYNKALFNCQQCCEKAMKSCLALTGAILADEHKIVQHFKGSIILKTKDKLKQELNKILPQIESTEWYYIPTRYPVTKDGEVYLRDYTEKEALEVYSSSEKFLSLCFEFIEKASSLKLPREKEELIKYLKENYKEAIKER